MENANTQNSNGNGNAKPDFVAKKQEGFGKNVSFVRIGAAWSREDGGLYLKLHGTQIIDGPIYLFPVQADQPENNQ